MSRAKTIVELFGELFSGTPLGEDQNPLVDGEPNDDFHKRVKDRLGQNEDEDDADSSDVTEGLHHNTKIKMLEANHHPTKVRLGLKECRRMVNEMLDPAHPSVNPADDEARKILENCSKRMSKMMESLRTVAVKKRG